MNDLPINDIDFVKRAFRAAFDLTRDCLPIENTETWWNTVADKFCLTYNDNKDNPWAFPLLRAIFDHFFEHRLDRGES